MKVQRSHLRIAVFVLLAAVGYNLWAYFKPAARTTPLVNRQQPMLSDAQSNEARGPQAVDPVSIPAPPAVDPSWSPSGGRDPFLFGDERRDAVVRAAQEMRAPDPMVRTILYSATRKTAIVGNRMVSVGDRVGSLTVAQIDRDAVIFASANGERRRVALHRGATAGIVR